MIAVSFIDPKTWGKPEKFSGKDEDWHDFRVHTLNYIGGISAQVHAVMEEHKWDTVSSEMHEADETAQQIIKSIYHFLASLCKKGKAKSTIRAIKDNNGPRPGEI